MKRRLVSQSEVLDHLIGRLGYVKSLVQSIVVYASHDERCRLHDVHVKELGLAYLLKTLHS